MTSSRISKDDTRTMLQVMEFGISRHREVAALQQRLSSTAVKQEDGESASIANTPIPMAQMHHERRRTNAHVSYRISCQKRLGLGRNEDGKGKDEAGEFVLSLNDASDGKKIVTGRRVRRQRRKLLQDKMGQILHTHVWHAKRMIMEEKWGVRIAKERYDQGTSAAIKAYRNKCILYDKSYYRTLELCGKTRHLLNVLTQIMDPEDPCFGSTFRPLSHASRQREIMLYEPRRFPFGAIAPVKLLWRPLPSDLDKTSCDQDLKRQLWLFIHPAAYKDVVSAWQEAEKAFALEATSAIEMCERTSELCHFELSGKDAWQILQTCLPNANVTHGMDLDSKLDAFEQHDDGFGTNIRMDVDANFQYLASRKHLTRAVVGMWVNDPRDLRFNKGFHILPRKHLSTSKNGLLVEPAKTAMSSDENICCPYTDTTILDEDYAAYAETQIKSIAHWSNSLEPCIMLENSMRSRAERKDAASEEDMAAATIKKIYTMPLSPLWSDVQRRDMATRFTPEHVINLARHKGDAYVSNAIPILAICSSKTKQSLPMVHIVLPPCYALAIWKALIFSGAHGIGRDSREAIDTIQHIPSFPIDFPDTKAGREYNLELEMVQCDKLKRRPIGKQFAYKKMGSPLSPDWRAIFPQEEELSDFCVLRGEKYMKPFRFYGNLQQMEKIPIAIPTLVRVSLRMLGRGSFAVNSTINLPSSEDIQVLRRSKKALASQVTTFTTMFPPLKNETKEEGSYARIIIGFVTSTGEPTTAIGFGSLCFVQDAFQYKNESREALVMIKHPTSLCLDPAGLRVEA